LANNEVLFLVVSVSHWVGLLLSLHETSTNSSGIFVADFINLNGVISAVEGNDESSSLIIWLCGDQDSLEPEDVHVLLEHFLHVNLWGLRFERENRSKRILWGSITVVSWETLISNVWSCLGELKRLLLNSHVLSVPLFSEIIAVIDKALSSIDDQFVSAEQI